MSLKSKLQSLIAAANAKTGKSAADLTAAVQDLIDGFGGTVQINFSIYDETIGFSLGTFSVAAGTTFREWTGPDGINAGRRIFCTGSDQSGAVLVGEGDCSLRYNGAAVHGTDEIISEATYTVVSDY